jgi:hypothetical protein
MMAELPERWSGPCAPPPVNATTVRAPGGWVGQAGAFGRAVVGLGERDLPAEVLLARIPEAHRHPLKPPGRRDP